MRRNSLPKRDERFGPKRRIKQRQDFLRIQQEGRKNRSRHFLVIVSPASQRVFGSRGTDAEEIRLGVTVTVRVDKRASRRNRLKRRVRECFRLCRHRMLCGVDVVVIALSGSTELDFDGIERELFGLWKRAGLFGERRAR